MLLLVRELTDVAASVAPCVGGGAAAVATLRRRRCTLPVAVADQATYLRVGGRSSWMAVLDDGVHLLCI